MFYEEIVNSNIPLITLELIEDAIKKFFILKEKTKNDLAMDDIQLIQLSFLLSIYSNELFCGTKNILESKGIFLYQIENYFNIRIYEEELIENVNIDLENYYDTYIKNYFDKLLDGFDNDVEMIYPEDMISDIINEIFYADYSNELEITTEEKEVLLESLQKNKMKRYNSKDSGIIYERLNADYLPLETARIIKSALKWYNILFKTNAYINENIKNDLDKISLCIFLSILGETYSDVGALTMSHFLSHKVSKNNILKYLGIKEVFKDNLSMYNEKELEDVYNNVFKNELNKMFFGIWNVDNEYKFIYPEDLFEEIVLNANIHNIFNNFYISDDELKEICSIFNNSKNNKYQEHKNKFFNINNYTERSIVNKNKINSVNYDKLQKYGRFLDEKEYSYNPAIGREEEIKNILITLLKPNKSAMLVGSAGVGKTAVVEGIAYLLKNGKVPEKLKNKKIISITTNSLLAGCQYRGQFEERVEEILEFLKNHKEVILFIDEIHTIMGAGSAVDQKLDFANILKPYLDRGDIKIIGSTTNKEYDELITDNALRRRFEKTDIKQLDNDKLKKILIIEIKKLENNYNIKFDFNEKEKIFIIDLLLCLTDDKNKVYNDKVNNPDLVLSILSDFFASASYYNRDKIILEDIKFAILRCDRIYDSVKERKVFRLQEIKNKNDVEKTKVLKLYPDKS